MENLDAIAQIHSYYITNNELYYNIEKPEEGIQQISRDASLYENKEQKTL